MKTERPAATRRQTRPPATRHATRRPGGFTLLEAILAISLSLALTAAMLVFYQQLIRTRSAVSEEAAFVRMERMVMDQMTAELRGALTAELGLAGRQDYIAMTVASLPGAAVWAEPNITEQPPPPEQDLLRVGYRLRLGEDADGEPLIEGLERTEQKLLNARLVEEGVEVQTMLLTPEIQFLQFQYWNGGDWTPSWAGEGLPSAVQVALGTKPLPENTEPQDYPYETFRRVVYLAGAARPGEGGGEEGDAILGPEEGSLP